MVKHTQTIHRQQLTNYLSVFNHFVGLKLKGLNVFLFFLECPDGFYKPHVGNQLCGKCGNNTLVARRTKCECLEKYYRIIGTERDDKADCYRKWNWISSKNIPWTASEQILTRDSRTKVFLNKVFSQEFR